MDAMSDKIATNLRNIRKEKKLSLDNVSSMTGVSKSMLGQIERGESSPTIATLWKIATGLHISFTALLEEEEIVTEIIKKEDVSVLLSDEGRFQLYPFFPFQEEKRFEIVSIEMDPGCSTESVAHTEGTEEYLIVYEGTVNLTFSEQTHTVHAGNAIRFVADKNHVYENIGEIPAKLCMVIYYKN